MVRSKVQILNLIIIFILMSELMALYVNPRHAQPSRVRFYPKNSVFRKSDLIDKGCLIFLNECPAFYKQKIVCARHYDGEYKSFNNYCELEYENCNSWRRSGEKEYAVHLIGTTATLSNHTKGIGGFFAGLSAFVFDYLTHFLLYENRF